MLTGHHRCRPVVDDAGNLVATFHGDELDERGRQAMMAVVAAAQRLNAEWDTPERQARQEAGRRLRAVQIAVLRRQRVRAAYRRRCH
jgi:hypothetical protein